MHKLWNGLMLLSLASMLAGCASRPALCPPPEVIRVPVTEFRELPAQCFRALSVPEPGPLNRDLAEAYRSINAGAQTQRRVLECCQTISHGQQCDLNEVIRHANE